MESFDMNPQIANKTEIRVPNSLRYERSDRGSYLNKCLWHSFGALTGISCKHPGLGHLPKKNVSELCWCSLREGGFKQCAALLQTSGT